MFKGESSFLDWREQTYPKWMSNMDIAESENLGTNVVHYRAHMVLAEMAKELGLPYQDIFDRAKVIKKGINQYLWMLDKGYYAQYRYGRSAMVLSPRLKNWARPFRFCSMWPIPVQAISILEKSPVTPFGATCIYPQIPGIPAYHNNASGHWFKATGNLADAKQATSRY
jgi:hypothetical protein